MTYAAGICGYSIGGTYTNCYHAGQLATANTSTSYKSTLSGIRCNSGSVNYCYYTSDCFPANSKYFYQIHQRHRDCRRGGHCDADQPGRRLDRYRLHWKLEDGALPTLTGCINPEGTCTCGCGCHCVPSEPDEPVIPEDALLLCDGVTGEVLKILNQADYISGRNDLLAGSLAYEGTDFTVNGTRKTAGDAQYTLPVGSTPPCGSKAGHEMDWTEENNVGATDLFQSDKVQNQRIYAYWIDAGYSQAQIGYWTDGSYAREVYINATVPDDIFQHYGFVVSTTDKETDASSLIIGGTIGGKPVGNFEKVHRLRSVQSRAHL